MNLRIRTASIADADVIADLHARSWQATYRGMFSDAFLDGPVRVERQTLWRQRLGNWDATRNVVLLALSAGTLKGFASVLLDLDPAWGARLDNLHVDPDAKGNGVGKLLLGRAAEWVLDAHKAPQLHLLVFERNEPARRFYEAMHGEHVERRETTVEDGTRLTELRYRWQGAQLAKLAAHAAG